jgi:hypothetical protein
MSESVSITCFEDIFEECINALDIVSKSSEIIFPADTRSLFTKAFNDFFEIYNEQPSKEVSKVDGLISDFENSYQDDSQNRISLIDDLLKAGLIGHQVDFKFKEFELAVNNFKSLGGISNLVALFTKGVIIVKSLVGIIPVIGSSIQELIDFVIERLKDLKG